MFLVPITLFFLMGVLAGVVLVHSKHPVATKPAWDWVGAAGLIAAVAVAVAWGCAATDQPWMGWSGGGHHFAVVVAFTGGVFAGFALLLPPD